VFAESWGKNPKEPRHLRGSFIFIRETEANLIYDQFPIDLWYFDVIQ